MKRLFLAAVVAVVATTAAQAQDHSPEAVAAAILTGFQTRDAAMIAPHSNETNEAFFADILSGTADANQLWEGDRGAAGIGWDGMILPVRYRNRGRAIVPFAIEGANGPVPLGSGEAGRYISIVLSLDGDEDLTWGFEDINYIDRDTYEGYLATR